MNTIPLPNTASCQPETGRTVCVAVEDEVTEVRVFEEASSGNRGVPMNLSFSESRPGKQVSFHERMRPLVNVFRSVKGSLFVGPGYDVGGHGECRVAIDEWFVGPSTVGPTMRELRERFEIETRLTLNGLD